MVTSGKVPALYKCFSILELLSQTDEFPGINEIARRLGLNKGTVSNIMHSLADLNVLEIRSDGKFIFGLQFYLLGNVARKRSELLQIAHPYLRKISRDTKLSAFLGIRADTCAVLIDKVDSTLDIKISSEIGLRMPPFAGAGIKAMISQMTDGEIDEILTKNDLKRYTPNSILNKNEYKKNLQKVREEGLAYDLEEYIEGLIALAIPVKPTSQNMQAAIWAVGLKRQITEEKKPQIIDYLKGIEKEINLRF